MSKTLIVVAAVVGVLVVAAGSFWAGMSFGESRATRDRQSLLEERLGQRGGQFPKLGQTPQPGQAGAQRFAGGVMGTIETVAGETLVVTTQQGDIQIETTDTTLIQKYSVGTIADLEAGEQVVVSGTQNEDGSYTARSIQVMPGQAPQ